MMDIGWVSAWPETTQHSASACGATCVALEGFSTSSTTAISEFFQALLAIIAEIALQVSGLIKQGAEWFYAQPFSFQIKALMSTAAVGAITSNFNAIVRVWGPITECKSLLNFTGLKIGRSEKFHPPVRALLLSFSFYAGYQVISHLTGYFVEATWAYTLMDAGVQVILASLLGVQFLYIWALARREYTSNDKKERRFWRTFHRAMSDQKIDLQKIAWSVAALPVAATTPKLLDLAVAGDQGLAGFSRSLSALLQ